MASTADFERGEIRAAELEDTDGLVFDKLGCAVVTAPPEPMQALGVAAAEDNDILAIEPERVVHELRDEWPFNVDIPPITPSPQLPGLPLDYLRGYRDAVNQLVDKILGISGVPGEVAEEAITGVLSELELTWGLQVTKVGASRFTGKGIRVAVLDTGLDLGHPDFAGRAIVSQSFVANQTVQDGRGHGTHCVGTACGPQQPRQLPRYGIAYEAEIFVGKVLNNRGSGVDGDILAGINWAVTNNCPIVSMSLGAAVAPGQTFSRVFETAARRSLDGGTLIIAAAGNDSGRPMLIVPVAHPANCPSIMAVAALDVQLRLAAFSNAGLNPQGGQIDIAGPGVNVRSSLPRPTSYGLKSGTSMAAPHVAGIAALHAQANSRARGRTLAQLLMQSARRLPLSGRDVGMGLVQAP